MKINQLREEASVMDNNLTPKERRQFGRRPSGLAGWLKVGGRPRLPCLIRNIAEKGALLELEVPPWLPFRFDLQVEGQAGIIRCEIRHVLSGAIGVTFIESAEKTTVISELAAASPAEEWGGKGGARPQAATARLSSGARSNIAMFRRAAGIK